MATIMIENRRLPLLFFTPKLQAYRGPCFQLLENTSSDHRITALGNIHNYPEGTHNVVFSSEVSSDRLFRAKINPEQSEFYWYLPFKIGGIPIIDFQYSSWLPRDYKQIYPRENAADIFEAIRLLRFDNLDALKTEDNHRIQTLTLPVVQEPQPQPLTQTPPIQRVKETKETSVPKHVHEALLRDAKSGTESCPISMNTYSECKDLSMTSCFHIFDKDSIDHWLRSNTTCPVCRKEGISLM
jgi:hypothetical protein